MATRQHITGLTLLIVLLLTCACQREGSFDTIWVVNIETNVKNLPEGVVKAVGKNWPHARIKAAQLQYGNGVWGDYFLTLELPNAHQTCSLLSKTGVVEWIEDCTG